MLAAMKQTLKHVLNQPQSWLCKKEFSAQTFTRFNERPVELSFVFKKLGEIYPQKILDVGTGTTALPHLMRNCGFLVTAIDNVRDYWPFGMANRHYHVIDDDITKTCLKEKFDLITCISVLEHIQQFNEAVRNMFSLLNPKGHIIITCPYKEEDYHKNVYELPDSSYGKSYSFATQSFSRNELEHWITDNDGTIVDQEYWQFWEGKYWTVGKQIIPPKRVAVNDEHQLTCLLIRKN